MTGNNASPITTSNEWTYRGEGNCNIVISLPKSRQILRIRKTEKPKSILGWILVLISDFLHWYYGIGFADEIRDLNFYNKIMRPLIGHKFTSESKQVMLSRKQMQIFKEGLSKKRPEFRKNKTLQYGRAALFNDFAYLPRAFDHLQFSEHTFSVEIKPKQGWRPPSEQDHAHCFFCMHQYLKLENKRIKSVTKYCPEELFSGDTYRMKTTLKHLIEVPQNNFKIFKNGSICFDEKRKNIDIIREVFEQKDIEIEILIEEFCDLLQRCLVKDLATSEPDFCNTKCEIEYFNVDSFETKLSKNSVLGRILLVQMLDQEGTHSTYKKLTKKSDLWDDFGFVDKILELIENNNSCLKCTVTKMPKEHGDELLSFLPYLISAIAKDCSLMITFRKLREMPCDDNLTHNIFKTQFGDFLVNIGVFDLYPKPLSTIHKHYKRNKDIFKALKKI